MSRPLARAPAASAVAHVRGDLAVVGTSALVLVLLAVFVVWPVLKVLALSLAGTDGLTLAHYAEFFSSGRLLRILLNSLAVSAVSTVILAWPITASCSAAQTDSS